MSPRTRAILCTVALSLNALAAALLVIANGGCTSPFPSGRVHLDACSGDGCNQPTPPAR